MRHGSVLAFISTFFMIQLFIAGIGSYLLAKWSPIYKTKKFIYCYWTFNIFSFIAVLFRRKAASLMFLEDDYLSELIKFLMNLAYVWSTGLLVMITALSFMYVVRLIIKIRNRRVKDVGRNCPANATILPDELNNISRRKFLKSVSAATPLFSFGISADCVFGGNSTIVVKRHEINIAKLNPVFDGLKIAQISDTHLGAYFGIDKLKRALNMVRNEEAQLLVITGDLIDELELLEPSMDILNSFAAQIRYGIYFCYGNHEYFRDFNKIRKAFSQSALTVLRNSNKLAIDGANPLYLIGVDYPWAGNGKSNEARESIRKDMLKKAMQGLPEKALPILISHHSDFIDEGFAADIPLTLSGHTHGGQAALLGKSLLPVSYKYMIGMYRQRNKYGYVSAGTGHWLPFRLNCPAEVGVFTLRNSF